MSHDSPEFNPSKREVGPFDEALRELLPGIEFEETPELAKARAAVLEALPRKDTNPELFDAAWMEYTLLCEEIVDHTDNDPPGPLPRAGRQIAVLVHGALIFRAVGDIERYAERLDEAIMYAHTPAHDGNFFDTALVLQDEWESLNP